MIRNNYHQKSTLVWGFEMPLTACGRALVALGLMVSTLIAQLTGRGRRALWVAGLPLLLAAVAPAFGREIIVVSPNALEFEEGDGTIGVTGGNPPYKWQQVFPASDFQSLPESHHLITRVSHRRPDRRNDNDFTEIWDHYQLAMSITSAGPDDISRVFADNIEAELTVVYDGPLTVEIANAGPPDGPKDFVAFDLQTPFEYDPSRGNLLIERITNTGITTLGSGQIDAFNSPITAVYTTDRDDMMGTWGTTGTYYGGTPHQFTFVASPGGSTALQAGDADMDCDFDQMDLVQVQVAAKYLSGQVATWGDGDWNGAPGGSVEDKITPPGDGQFDQLDIMTALAAGTYLQGSYCAEGATAAFAIPEPSTLLLLAFGLTGMLVGWRRKR